MKLFKSCILLVLLALGLSQPSANTNLTQLINGVFEQAGLPDQSSLSACYDEETSQALMTLIGNLLQQATTGLISNIQKIEQEVKAFVQSIPEPVQQCLNTSQDSIKVAQAFCVYNQDPNAVQKKVEEYVVMHFSELKADVATMNTDYSAGNYNQVGKDGGAVLQEIFGKCLSHSLSPQQQQVEFLVAQPELPDSIEKIFSLIPQVKNYTDALSKMIYGFEQMLGFQPSPNVTNGYDEDTARDIVKFLEESVHLWLEHKEHSIKRIEKNYELLMKKIPERTTDYYSTNEDFLQTKMCCCISESDSNTKLLLEVFAIKEEKKVTQAAQEIKLLFFAGYYPGIGRKLASLAQESLGDCCIYRIF